MLIKESKIRKLIRNILLESVFNERFEPKYDNLMYDIGFIYQNKRNSWVWVVIYDKHSRGRIKIDETKPGRHFVQIRNFDDPEGGFINYLNVDLGDIQTKFNVKELQFAKDATIKQSVKQQLKQMGIEEIVGSFTAENVYPQFMYANYYETYFEGYEKQTLSKEDVEHIYRNYKLTVSEAEQCERYELEHNIKVDLDKKIENWFDKMYRLLDYYSYRTAMQIILGWGGGSKVYRKAIKASEMVVGTRYEIKKAGKTEFTDVGALSNKRGTIFIAKGIPDPVKKEKDEGEVYLALSSEEYEQIEKEKGEDHQYNAINHLENNRDALESLLLEYYEHEMKSEYIREGKHLENKLYKISHAADGLHLRLYLVGKSIAKKNQLRAKKNAVLKARLEAQEGLPGKGNESPAMIAREYEAIRKNPKRRQEYREKYRRKP